MGEPVAAGLPAPPGLVLMRVLGVDRDSDSCAELFDESDGAVLDAIGLVVAIARKHGVTSSLCGQAHHLGIG